MSPSFALHSTPIGYECGDCAEGVVPTRYHEELALAVVVRLELGAPVPRESRK